MAYDGGSSKVFKKALKAWPDNMWTSSMIYTLCFPVWGGILTWSIRFLISSTPLLEAASNSNILKEKSEDFSSLLFMFFANILAHVVFPTPLGPQNNKACGNWFCLIAFSKVFVIELWPITLSKLSGLYFNAETTKSFI